MNILFWNINNKDLSGEIKEFSNLKNIDVIILCEHNIHEKKILGKLNQSNQEKYKILSIPLCEKIRIITKIDTKYFSVKRGTHRWAIIKIARPNYVPFILATVHLISKRNANLSDQLIELQRLRGDINAVQKQQNIFQSIVIGDFNINPFEESLVAATTFNTTSDKRIALKKKRIVQKKEYEYFYNPMWNFLGDESIGQVSGTYYYRSGHISYDWHIFDQLLINPNMIPYVKNKDIEILTEAKTFSLIKENGRINGKEYSDHLPIKFKIYPIKH